MPTGLKRFQQSKQLHFIAFLCAKLCFMAVTQAQQHDPPALPVKIPHVRSGQAVIHQNGLTTTLSLTPRSSNTQKIPLTHKSESSRLLTLPYQASVIAEIPNKLLIFTDTFVSNPDNTQGACGANDTGETYLHVVSLTRPLRETFSALIDSCLLGINKVRAPIFDPSTHNLTFNLSGNVDLPYTFTYHIASDNSVTLIQPVGWHGYPKRKPSSLRQR